MECGLRHGELCCIMVVSNTGCNEPLNNHEKDVKIQKENEVCICDFGALKTHILNFSSATMKSVYFF